ncbi:MAG: PDZ domain-containing protein [Lachnospiraceae bacterium]|nr:PDZ domain-containing protein [Lachnospiraceae bacterium]
MYENDNMNSEQNNVYQTSQTMPEMRLNIQPPQKPKKQGGAGKYFKKLLASISFGLCFGLFTGLGLYAVCEGTGVLENISRADEDEIRQVVEEALDDQVGKGWLSSGIETEKPNVQSSSGIDVTQTITAITSDVSEVVEEVMPAMVSIKNEYVQQYSYFGKPMSQTYTSSGSGIIVGENDTELLIATNHHVIEDADKLTVVFIDGSEIEAVWKGSDSEMDLAVIAIPLANLTDEVKGAISIAKLGDSDSLQLGQPVIAIGNALGIGQSVSGGYVSALNRELTMSDGSKGTFIQTDAAINQGNSGGALLNIKGEVIGINSNKIGGELVEGMGFAIPISAAQPILEELMAKVTRTEVADQQGYIGIRLQTVTREDAQRYGMTTGIYVYEVLEDSAASRAGLLHGDIITKFDGTRVESNEELQELLVYYNVEETVELTIMRRNQLGKYEEMKLPITLGEKPAE